MAGESSAGEGPQGHRDGHLALVGVVIPARDEGETIEDALRAVVRALRVPSLRHARRFIVVAVDNSSDDTAHRARRWLQGCGAVVEGSFGSAGAARRAGLEIVLKRADDLLPSHVWLATTDADSRVPLSWLSDQGRWWRHGADAVVGTVTPIWEAKAEHQELRVRYDALISSLGVGPGHPHVYGANLGFTLETYLAGAGMPLLESGEDHALIESFRAQGALVVSVADEPVRTSARFAGRAPDGFADLLSHLARDLQASS